MPSASAGRASHWQHTHYLRRTFDFNTAGFSTALTGYVGTLPPGAITRGTMVKVQTAFNSVTSDVLDVGWSGAEQALVAAADITAAGGQFAITGMDATMPTEATDVFAKWTGTGTAPTQGRVTVIVEYFANNDL